jgi:hypothetical protein
VVVPVSSLSVAIQGIADYLDSELGEDVAVSVDNPQAASEAAKGASKHLLNLFFYRIAPSGFHADAGADEPYFVRLHALLTPFHGAQQQQTDDAELRILGHTIRVLQSCPVLPPLLPGAPAGGDDDFREQPGNTAYQLQAIMQSPSMEELNHIWTTQGGELAYRLSAAYEFALVPIEPLVRRAPGVPMRTAIVDVLPHADRSHATGFIELGQETTEIPLGGESPANPEPPTNWLPVVLAVDDGALTTRREIAAGTASIEVALAGLRGERVGLEVIWTRAAAPEVPETQAAQVFTIQSHVVDAPAARATLALSAPAAGDVAVVRTRPVDGAGAPLAHSPFANTLTLTVPAAPP